MGLDEKLGNILHVFGLGEEEESKSLSEQVREFKDAYDITEDEELSSGEEDEAGRRNLGASYESFTENRGQIKDRVDDVRSSITDSGSEELLDKVEELDEKLEELDNSPEEED
ncbi:MAG: hypothetical protein ABEJ36_05960 [Candidatus Nanosalina sp.]